MEIRFSQPEIALISSYFNRIDSGKTPKQWHELSQAAPEWNTVFLLLRKLLAYGVRYNLQADSEISYKDLQTKSQKPDSMWVTVHTHMGQFKDLLALYTAHHAMAT